MQIEVASIDNLLQLTVFLVKEKNLNQYIMKTMIETRENISGRFKGLIYCQGLNDAEEVLDFINKANLPFIDRAFIKRGCTEFYSVFPEYEKLNEDDYEVISDDWWPSSEKSFLNSSRNFKLPVVSPMRSHKEAFGLKDILIINKWFNHLKRIEFS